jgi:peptidoglycan/xylan/chitin deacetylase (PgdA/CDA1 family)
LLYHRVNDTSRDKLTTSVNRFIEHLATLKRYYPVISLAEARTAFEAGRYLGPNAVVITFDDGYADNHDIAAPILEHFGFPATFFVSAGIVGTPVSFVHDAGSPYQFKNLTWSDVRSLAARGFEVGSHGLSHANLARSPLEMAKREIVDSRDILEKILGQRIRSFAYPFGGQADMTPAVVREVHDAGYELLQSAYGGVNVGRLDPSNVLRVGMSDRFDRWALRAEIAGISLQAIRQRWTAPRRATSPGSDLGSERQRA